MTSIMDTQMEHRMENEMEATNYNDTLTLSESPITTSLHERVSQEGSQNTLREITRGLQHFLQVFLRDSLLAPKP